MSMSKLDVSKESQYHLAMELERLLYLSKDGNKEAEEEMCNLLCQIRISCASKFAMRPLLFGMYTYCTRWLRLRGRKVNFDIENPREWISK